MQPGLEVWIGVCAVVVVALGAVEIAHVSRGASRQDPQRAFNASQRS